MIIFNGVSSDELGVIVEHYPRLVFPKRKVEVFQIPGRNGDLLIDQEVYENYEQTYEVFFDSKYRGGLEAAMPKIASWLLSGIGYGRLEDSYSKEYYRMAYVPQVAEFLNYFNEYGRGSLTFNCAPQRFYKTGENEIQVQNGQTLHNPNGFKAWPLIRLTTSSGTLNVHFTDSAGTRTATIETSTRRDTYVDTQEHTVYQRNGSEIIYGSSTDFSGLYEDLYLKDDTSISWEPAGNSYTNAPQFIYVKPRWWTI